MFVKKKKPHLLNQTQTRHEQSALNHLGYSSKTYETIVTCIIKSLLLHVQAMNHNVGGFTKVNRRKSKDKTQRIEPVDRGVDSNGGQWGPHVLHIPHLHRAIVTPGYHLI